MIECHFSSLPILLFSIHLICFCHFPNTRSEIILFHYFIFKVLAPYTSFEIKVLLCSFFVSFRVVIAFDEKNRTSWAIEERAQTWRNDVIIDFGPQQFLSLNPNFDWRGPPYMHKTLKQTGLTWRSFLFW